MNTDAWKRAYESRTDLSPYGDNALGLFALALKYGLDDLESVAAECLTDGPDDKKADLVWVHAEEEEAVVAQCYFSSKSRASAPSNKASDLNTAITWLLHSPLGKVPERLRSPAEELRDAIRSGVLKTLRLWYVHNLPESRNVRDELEAAEATAASAISKSFPKSLVSVVGRAGANCLSWRPTNCLQ